MFTKITTIVILGASVLISQASEPSVSELPKDGKRAGQIEQIENGKRVESVDKIEQILTRLQERSDGLRDIRCHIRLREEDQINLTGGTKQGEIFFLMTEPNPNFLIYFDRSERDGVLGKREWYLFDGRWLYEGLERIKQVTQREYAKPGEHKDLFDLETAPFPLPFGQKKETILKHFDVRLADPANTDPPNTDHLVCVPKLGSRLEGKYDKLEFFVRKDVDLPSRVVVTRNNGLEIIAVDFPDLSPGSIDTGLKNNHFALSPVWTKDNYKFVVERADE